MPGMRAHRTESGYGYTIGYILISGIEVCRALELIDSSHTLLHQFRKLLNIKVCGQIRTSMGGGGYSLTLARSRREKTGSQNKLTWIFTPDCLTKRRHR
jgi:hypothetical protein